MEDSGTSPIRILKDAQKAVPAVRYASGVAGIAAVAAIVAGFLSDVRIAVFGTVLVLGSMFVLVIFSAFAAHRGPSVVILAAFAAWAFLLLTVSTVLLLMTSYFFAWPRAMEWHGDDRTAAERTEESQDEGQADIWTVLEATGYAALSSEPGDYIGQGGEYQFSDDNGLFSARGDRNAVSIFFEGDDHWSFDFAAPRGEALAIGEYASAQRAAFHNPVKPGIEVSGAGRGCNEISGRFVINDVEFTDRNRLKRFSAAFEQHCEGAVPALKGEVNIRVND